VAVSFIIDLPALIASGAAIERYVDDDDTARVMKVGIAGVFVGGALALYANAPGLRRVWAPFGSRSGREFMVTSGLAPVDERTMTRTHHALSLALLASYPLWLLLGAALARRRRG
jgi:hypothetical protein